ncbi:MAG TPA: hypothetical protein VGQ38_09415 [Gaiellaceae bacterium]|jgi:hypothetical protein|nr:hypothetical protein [Gaiellaceae bacterium]
MSTTTSTIDDQLAQVRRRIDRLSSHAHHDKPRVWRHLEPLRRAQDAVLAALRQRSLDEVEENLAQLKTRLDIAEHSLEADAAEDWASFATAIEAELQSWDIYLERLQATAVATAWKTREQTESAIGDLRSRRIAAGERLAKARRTSGDVSPAARKHITAARNELDKRAAELSTKFN